MKINARELRVIGMYIDEMRKIERQVRRLNEIDCNTQLTPRQASRRVKLEERYASMAATEFKLFTEFQRDPRGAALKLHDSNKEMDSSSGVVL